MVVGEARAEVDLAGAGIAAAGVTPRPGETAYVLRAEGNGWRYLGVAACDAADGRWRRRG